ncbi:hypothetical protein [Haliscomenobacter sp.]|uniref:hypothetical protein n=1 Tax=Haliscomenobacter sp. TaxID=2717303 RepID=UPI003BACC013
MAMSDDEKMKVLEMLGRLDKDERDLVLRSIDSFTNWLKNTLSWIYIKIKDAINSLFNFLDDIFG